MLAYQTSVFGQGAPTVLDTGVERTWLDEFTWVDHAHTWLAGADELLADLADALPWRHSRRPMYGRLVDEPRLHAMLDADSRRRYPVLDEITEALESRYGEGLSPGFVNYYPLGLGLGRLACRQDRNPRGEPDRRYRFARWTPHLRIATDGWRKRPPMAAGIR